MDEMMHVIKKQTIALQVSPDLDVFHVQQQASDHFWSQLVPLLTSAFDQISGEGETIYLDRMEIDLGVFSEKDFKQAVWDDAILHPVSQQVNQQLSVLQGNPEKQITIYSKAANSYQQWLFYMQQGYLPWNVVAVNERWYNEVLAGLSQNEVSLAALRIAVKEHQDVLQRIIRQHSSAFLVKLAALLTVEKDAVFMAEPKKLDETSWENILKGTMNLKNEGALSSYKDKSDKVIPEIWGDSSSGKLKEVPDDDVLLKRPVKDEEVLAEEIPALKIVETQEEQRSNQRMAMKGLFVRNAGVVLIHPFLKDLFRETGLLEGRYFVDHMARQKAVYLIHYLATGKNKAAEYQLVIPKLLCGYPVKVAVSTRIKLTRAEMKEARDMLEAAVSNWDILKNTTIAGLREGFLQRNGKVSSQKDKLVIHIEKEALDILIDYLPWNLNLVKLPWLEDVLTIEWR